MLRALVLATSALLVGLASPAWADKDKDKGGKGKHGQGRGGPAVVVQPVRVVVPDQDRAIVYQYYRSEFSAGRCPPGLAKKGNGCLPPGQARQPPPLWVIGQPLPPAIVYERVPPTVVQRVVTRLTRDLQDGTWVARHGHLLTLDTLDAGLRLVVATPR